MKINLVKTVIAIAISLLIAFGFFSFYKGENKFLLSSGSFIFLMLTLIMAVGIKFELSRTNTNLKVVSGIFFVIALISNIAFSFSKFSVPIYIIVNGILLLVFVFIAYSIFKAKQ